jgi:hypothetical protein
VPFLQNASYKALVLSVAHLEKLPAIRSMLLNLFAYMSNSKPESNLGVVDFVIINMYLERKIEVYFKCRNHEENVESIDIDQITFVNKSSQLF